MPAFISFDERGQLRQLVLRGGFHGIGVGDGFADAARVSR